MADYPIIADVSAYLAKMLRTKMCPEPIPSPNNIEVSSPLDQDVDYIMGVYLYDIREEGEMARPNIVNRTRLRRPPRPYSLYYMIYLNGSSQMGLKAQDIQKIIGRAAQVINDGSSVSPNELQTWLEEAETPIIFSPTKLALQEKASVWSSLNKPYQISLFYRAAPVYLSSEITVDMPRVLDAEFISQQGVSFGVKKYGKS